MPPTSDDDDAENRLRGRQVSAICMQALQVMKRGALQESLGSAPCDAPEAVSQDAPMAQQIRAYPGARASSTPMPAVPQPAQDFAKADLAEQLQGDFPARSIPLLAGIGKHANDCVLLSCQTCQGCCKSSLSECQTAKWQEQS